MLGKRRSRAPSQHSAQPKDRPQLIGGSRPTRSTGKRGSAALRAQRDDLDDDDDGGDSDTELRFSTDRISHRTAGSDDEEQQQGEGEDEDGDAEDGETADEKRVRLTRLYLQSIKQGHRDGAVADRARRSGVRGDQHDDGASGMAAERAKVPANGGLAVRGAVGEDGDDGDDGGDDDDDEMEDVISHRLHSDLDSQHGQRHTTSIAALISQSPSVRSLRGHRLSATCTALSSDERAAYSGSKDGSIVQWDVEAGRRSRQWSGSGAVADTKKRQGVLALSASSDGRLLASAGQDGSIRVWDIRSMQLAAQAVTAPSSTNGHQHTINEQPAHSQSPPPSRTSSSSSRRSVSAAVPPSVWCEWSSAHRSPVSALSFRMGSLDLFSASFDRTVKLFDAGSKAYVETLFGHTAEVQDVHCLNRNRAVSVASDKTARLWKVVEESQLLFRIDTVAPVSSDADGVVSPSSLSLDCCRMLDDDHFLTGGDDGSVALWNINKKRPMHMQHRAHGKAWIVSVGACPFSDVAFSGSSDGHINVYQCNTANTAKYHKADGQQQSGGRREALHLLTRIPCAGYVNSLSCGASGRFLVAGTGQEHRIGRWTDNIRSARNGIAIIDLSAQRRD